MIHLFPYLFGDAAKTFGEVGVLHRFFRSVLFLFCMALSALIVLGIPLLLAIHLHPYAGVAWFAGLLWALIILCPNCGSGL